jgi:hypothetical protein
MLGVETMRSIIEVNRLKRELMHRYIKGEIDDVEFVIRFETLVREGIRATYETGKTNA